MALTIQSTRDAINRNFIAIYGRSGVGKTSLLVGFDQLAQANGQRAIQLEFDKGNLALADYDLLTIPCESLQDAYNIFGWISSDPGWSKFDYIFLDGATKISEDLLDYFLLKESHGQQAYKKAQETFHKFIKFIKAIPNKYIVVTFQQQYVQNDINQMIYTMALPGRQLPRLIPYEFDEVFCMRLETNASGVSERIIQTQPDVYYDAKDRSGKLAAHEPPDLKYIINKISQPRGNTQ